MACQYDHQDTHAPGHWHQQPNMHIHQQPRTVAAPRPEAQGMVPPKGQDSQWAVGVVRPPGLLQSPQGSQPGCDAHSVAPEAGVMEGASRAQGVGRKEHS